MVFDCLAISKAHAMARAERTSTTQLTLSEQEFAEKKNYGHHAVGLSDQHYPPRIVRRQAHNILSHGALRV